MGFSSFKSYGYQVAIPNIVSVVVPFTNPSTMTGNQLWLDCKDYSTLVLNGNSLTSWTDKSGFNRSATKFDNSSTNATYVSNGFNNLPAIQINKDQGLSVDIPSGTFANGLSLFVVFQKNGAIETYESLVTRTVDYNGRPFDIYNSRRIMNAVEGKNSPFYIRNATNLNLFSMTLKSSWDEYVDGTSTVNFDINSSYVDDATKLYIGTRDDKFTDFNGVISEVIMYDSVLSTDQRQKIEGYLANKWNITSRLPISHLYR
jgi:hypothetical protein